MTPLLGAGPIFSLECAGWAPMPAPPIPDLDLSFLGWILPAGWRARPFPGAEPMSLPLCPSTPQSSPAPPLWLQGCSMG